MTEQFEQFRQNLEWFSGRITEVKIDFFESGKCKATFAIPLKKNKDDEAIFLNCVLWNKKAEEFAEKYKKGDEVCIGGYFTENEYNNKKYVTFNVKVAY